MFRRTANKGFTLAELMVASSILVILLGAYLGAFQNILKNASYSEGLSWAYTACRSKLEEMVDYDFSSIRRDYAAGGTPGSTFVPAGFPATFTVMGNVTVTDRQDLYGGGEQLVASNPPTSNPPWTARYGHTSVVYDNRMWIIGGRAGGGVYLNDVWSSTDGINWSAATSSANWTVRYGHTSVVYANKMWVMGGNDDDPSNPGYLNDVWYSNDGINWTVATDDAGWSDRYAHVSVVYDNRMWVMSGFASSGPSNPRDVWSSTDGINWTRATPAAGWQGRISPVALVYDNQMWIMGGGGNRNDVWYSNDGISWTEALPNVNRWPGREGHAAVVYDNKMWVTGGSDSGGRLNDIWYSNDGINWSEATSAATWSARDGQPSVVYANKMWLMSGKSGGTYYRDVWSSAGYDRLLEVVITVCWQHPDGRIFGEDANLDGTWDQATEDANNNGRFDSPAQLRVMISEKNMLNLRKIFLGRP